MSTTVLAGSPSALMPTAQSVSKLTIPTATRLIAASKPVVLSSASLASLLRSMKKSPTASVLLKASRKSLAASDGFLPLRQSTVDSRLTALPTSFPASLLPSSAVSTTVLAGSPSALMPTAQSVSKLTIPTATRLIAASKPVVLSSASLASLLRSMKKSPTASVLLKASRKSLAASDGFLPLRQSTVDSRLTALPTSFPASLLPSSAVSTTVLAGSPSALMPTAQSVSKLTIPTATKLIAASKPVVLSSASLASLLRSMKKSPTAPVLLKASRKSLAASDGFPPLRQPQSSAISLTPVEPSTTPNPTSCQVGTCRNGGTCSMPSHTCLCRKYFAWYDCTVYVGK